MPGWNCYNRKVGHNLKSRDRFKASLRMAPSYLCFTLTKLESLQELSSMYHSSYNVFVLDIF